MMHARKLMLTVLGSGTLLGTLAGLAVDTNMKPPPDPPWRHMLQQATPSADSYQLVDSGPQDLSPRYFVDHTPTWKRGQTYDGLTYGVPDYVPLNYADAGAELPAQPAAASVRMADPDVTSPETERRQLAAMEAAAAAQDAAGDAQAPAGNTSDVAARNAAPEHGEAHISMVPHGGTAPVTSAEAGT